jgi:hypothetical protein
MDTLYQKNDNNMNMIKRVSIVWTSFLFCFSKAKANANLFAICNKYFYNYKQK